MKKRITSLFLSLILCWSTLFCTIPLQAQTINQDMASENLVDYVNTLIGVNGGSGSCIAGPTMPNGSINPSPETRPCSNGGYTIGQPVTGFGQAYAQGTGGTQSYGQFLISPQTGTVQTSESNHTSPVSGEVGRPYYYTATLSKYNIKAEIAPANHAAIYQFTYPESSESSFLLDVSRKIGDGVAIKNGSISIDKASKTISGGGTFGGNWNPAQWNMYFALQFDKDFSEIGTWDAGGLKKDVLTQSISTGTRLGAYVKFNTSAGDKVKIKIAISFTSEQSARELLNQEIPDWDFDKVKANAQNSWNDILSRVQISGDDATKQMFYTAFYHANVQPRNRVDDHGNWDDYYTIWDSWKTAFPFYNLVRPDLVASNINSFINRYNTSGYISDAYIQGKEFICGQGGNDIENIIADAYLKDIPGVDWEEAYAAAVGNATSMRTPDYVQLGYQSASSAKVASNGMSYSSRLYPSSATLGFAYNDYALSQMAKGLGKTDDYERYSARSNNWETLWNDNVSEAGFSGFAINKNKDGTFPTPPDPTLGWNTHYYEASIWEGSYFPVYDIPGLIEKMGGRVTFIKRLEYAFEKGYINFANEPSFQTIWLFASDEIKRPDLASKWANEYIKEYTATGYPGDEDNGAMSTMYMFLMSGFFPISGTNNYYLHGTHLPEVTYHLSNGKQFKIVGYNTADANIYVQSVKLNGQDINVSKITYDQIMDGGTLEFYMGDTPSGWARNVDIQNPTSVENLTADGNTVKIGRIKLNWTEATDDDMVEKYIIYRGSSSDFIPDDTNKVSETTQTMFMEGLSQAGTYYYKVIAVDASGKQSEPQSVSVQIPELSQDSKFGEPGIDIARDQGVTQSSYTKDAENGVKAVDGDLKTKWCAKDTSLDNGAHWLEVDLGDIYCINRWVVTHASGATTPESASYNTKDFKLQAKVGDIWVDVDTVTNNTAAKTDRKTLQFNAQYVRLYITQAAQLGQANTARIYGFELYSPDTRFQTPSLLNGAGVELSTNSNASSTETAVQAVDRDNNTKWSARYGNADMTVLNPEGIIFPNGVSWMKMDLGKVCSVNEMKFLGSGVENAAYISKSIYMQTSKDGVNWTYVKSYPENQLDYIDDVWSEPVISRYFRLVLPTDGTANSNARVREFHLYGEEVPSYTVTLPNTTDAVITASQTQNVLPGEVVTVNITDIVDGKELASISAESDETTIDLSKLTVDVPEGTLRYTFTMPENNITIKADFYVTSATLNEIVTPAAITAVANGTEKTAEALGLPATVKIATDKGTMNAGVEWYVYESNYDPLLTTEQTFIVIGAVYMPDGVVNPNNIALTTSISVTVNAETDTDKILVSITTPAAITGVANGTEKTAEALGLPATVKIATDKGTMNAGVEWYVYESNYDPSITTEQIFTVAGAVYLPDRVTNPNNIALTAIISVTVNAETVRGKNADLSRLEVVGVTLNPGFAAGITSYAATVPNSTGSIVVKATAEDTKATVSGTGEKLLSPGKNNIVITVRAEDGTIKTYTIIITRNENSGNNSGGGGSSGTPVTTPPTTQIENTPGTVQAPAPVVNNAGVASTAIDADALTKALKESDTAKINVPKAEGASAYEAVLPATALVSENTSKKIEIATELGKVTVPGSMLTPSDAAGAQSVGITIAKADTDVFDTAVKSQIGKRPAVELIVSIDGRRITWSNPEAPVTVQIPYTPTAAELADPERIVVWYIDEAGKAVAVPTGKYDSETGNITFTSTHSGNYAVTYVKKNFDDIGKYSWASRAIEVLAAKGIINGTSETTFNPSADIRRADFIVLLVKALGLSAKPQGNFTDVSSSAYYADALATAKALGITAGVGNNNFNPNAKISREDMVVLAARAMEKAGKPLANASDSELEGYSDSAQISGYALNDVAALIKAGIIKGSGNTINPKRTATRAEAAVIIYNLYNR